VALVRDAHSGRESIAGGAGRAGGTHTSVKVDISPISVGMLEVRRLSLKPSTSSRMVSSPISVGILEVRRLSFNHLQVAPRSSSAHHPSPLYT